MALSNDERLAAIHEEALEDFDRIYTAQWPERLESIQDRRFYSRPGAQWDGDVGDQFENKPRLEFNSVHLAVIRIINEYRNNRISVDFQPKDGSDNDEFADVCDGLYRADEQRCTANEAYDNAFEEGVGGGMGAWRLRAVYEDEEDEEGCEQVINIEPIFDADQSVFFDLDGKRQDKADAKRCYVLSPMTKDAYEEQYGDDPTSWPRPLKAYNFEWLTPDFVWLAELYKVEEVPEKVNFYRHVVPGIKDEKLRQADIKEDPSLESDLKAKGYKLSQTKTIKRKRVHKYLMNGDRILEDCGFIAGKCIPIVPFYGKRWVTDGVERFLGHVRMAKDAARLKNMILSWLAEMVARFDVEKPILTPEQIQGYEPMWAEDPIKRYPYLLINATTDENGNRQPIGPIAYTRAPQLPPAMAALMQAAQGELQDLLGNQAAGEELQPNQSGKAVELIQNRLDMQVFIYMSNLSKSMKRSGEIWFSMKEDITVEDQRKMKVIHPDGESGSVTMNQPTYDDETGEETLANSFQNKKYDVVVDVGPSSNSLRSAVVRALTGIASVTADPELQQALTYATIANLEGEGLNDLRAWARSQAIKRGMIKPTDEEAAELAKEQQNAQNQAPAPSDAYLLAQAQKTMADKNLSEANTALAQAKTDQIRVDNIETLHGIGHKDATHSLNAASAFAGHAIAAHAATKPDPVKVP